MKNDFFIYIIDVDLDRTTDRSFVVGMELLRLSRKH